MGIRRYLDKVFFLADIWTIGFIDDSAENIVASRNGNPHIKWIKHKYKDRFFADPFILDVLPDGSKRILVEEMIWSKAKGTIVELLISHDNELVNRNVVLEEDVHLSYPFIVRRDGDIYMYPESCHNRRLAEYKYMGGRFVYMRDVIKGELCDSTLLCEAGKEWIFCTYRGNNQDNELHILYDDEAGSGFKEIASVPAKVDIHSSRPGGDFIRMHDGGLIRVAQDSSKSYGWGLSFMRVDKLSEDAYSETFDFGIYPDLAGECPRGIHTFNSYKGVTVVDGIRRKRFDPVRKLLFVARNLFGI